MLDQGVNPSWYYGLSNNRPGRLFFFNFFAVPGRSYSSWSIINVQESHRPTPCLRIPFFFSGGLIFLLIFFNVLMMYKNIFFYTFRNFLEFVIIKIVSKSRFSQKWKSRMFIFERASLNFDTVYEVILMYFIKAWSWLLKKIGKQTGKVGLFQGWSIIPVGLLLSFSVHFSLVYYSRWSIIRDSIVLLLFPLSTEKTVIELVEYEAMVKWHFFQSSPSHNLWHFM